MRKLWWFPVVAALLLGACASDSATISSSVRTSDADEESSQIDDSNASAPDGNEDFDDSDDSGSGSSDDGAPNNDGDRPQSFEDIDWTSPLSEYFGDDFTDQEAQEEDFARMEAEAEIETAECMQNLGFEYKPSDSSSMMVFGGPGDELPYFSDEWIAKYGFGISTQRFPQSMVGPNLVGFDDEEMSMQDDDFEDPNQEYVETLSETAREAYYLALWGESPEFDPSIQSDEEMEALMEDFEPSGCYNLAREELFNRGGNGLYEAFGDQLDQMYERAEADPRVVDFRTKVSRCVADKGLDYGNEGMRDLFERFESELGTIGQNTFQDPFEAAGINPDDMTPEEMEAFFENLGPPSLSPEEQATLADVQEREIKLATAVVECDGGPLNEQYFIGYIRAEYEQEFIDRNADALEEFRPAG